MSRYEIEEILSQDKRGIIFRAHDSEKGLTVALRRFFPFGQDGGGLKEEEIDAFRIAAERLVGVSHPALRSVFSGAVDPIDNMPFMVAEWVDGAKLGDVLNGETLDPMLVIQILQLALEVSLMLSEILGEEAVWVETAADSIFLGSEESGRGFVFWLSPFKWLGAEFRSRKLGALVDLGEQLAGWKGKLIGDHAGQGLGGWLKWMKNNPDASLAQALETLPSFTSDGDSPSPPKPTFLAPVAAHPAVKVKQPSSISPVMIAACVGLVLAVAGLAYYRLTAKAPDVPTLYAEQTISPAQLEPTPGKSTAIQPDPTPAPAEDKPPVVAVPKPTPQAGLKPTPLPGPAPTQDSEAISISRVQEMANKLAKEKEAKRAAALAPPVVAAPPVRDFTPGDGEKMRLLKANGSASVTGVVLNVRLSKAGNSLYFEFSKPTNAKEIMAVAHKKSYQGDFTTTAYKDLIGKKVRFDGTVFREPGGKQYVKIGSREKMKVVP
jgi:hypothetical protein